MGNAIVFDGKPQPVAHIVDVSLDGFARNLQLRGEARAIEGRAIAQPIMDTHHALDGETGSETSGGGIRSHGLILFHNLRYETTYVSPLRLLSAS